MLVFHKMKIQNFMEVKNPRLLDAEGTGSTFPQNACIYWPQEHTSHKTSVFIHTLSKT